MPAEARRVVSARKCIQPYCYNSPVPAFCVQNFGCRATQADGAAIERQIADQGLHQAQSATNADVVVLNTCTVTAGADQDARAAIRRVHRTNPDARILVTGCYAQRAPEEVAALPGVTWVVGNSHKHRVAEIAALGRTLDSPQQNFVPVEHVALSSPAFTLIGDIFAHTELAHIEFIAAPVISTCNI